MFKYIIPDKYSETGASELEQRIAQFLSSHNIILEKIKFFNTSIINIDGYNHLVATIIYD